MKPTISVRAKGLRVKSIAINAKMLSIESFCRLFLRPFLNQLNSVSAPNGPVPQHLPRIENLRDGITPLVHQWWPITAPEQLVLTNEQEMSAMLMTIDAMVPILRNHISLIADNAFGQQIDNLFEDFMRPLPVSEPDEDRQYISQIHSEQQQSPDSTAPEH